jgi:hypothetical protein
MDNATRRQLLEQAKQVGYTGSILDVFQNPQVLDQFAQEQQSQQQTQVQQPQQQMQVEMPTPPATTPNYRVEQPRQSEAKPLVMSNTEVPIQIRRNGGIKFDNGGPKDKGWREYKTPTGESLYLDPRFKDQRYYVNEKGDHITPNQNMSLYDVNEKIWESGTSLPTLNISPRYKYEQRPGALGAMETIRVDLDNNSQQTISPDVMATKREMDSFANSFNPAGLAVQGVSNMAQGNIVEGALQTALSIPVVGQAVGKVIGAPFKFIGNKLASTYGPALSEVGRLATTKTPLRNAYNILPKSTKQLPGSGNVNDVVKLESEILKPRFNLQRSSSKPKDTMFNKTEDLSDETFNITKTFKGRSEEAKTIPRSIDITGKSGNWQLNKNNNGTFSFSATMTNPVESGRAMLKMDKLMPPKPTILEEKSYSLDSWLNHAKLKNRPHWSGEFNGYIPLNHSAVHNKSLAKFVPEATIDYSVFKNQVDAEEALQIVNNLIKKQGVAQEAKILKTGDAYQIQIPNFKLTRDYKTGGVMYNYGGITDPPSKTSNPQMPIIQQPAVSTAIVPTGAELFARDTSLQLAEKLNTLPEEQPTKEYYPTDSYIKQLRLQENAGKTGYKQDKFYPYNSVEGGTPTIAYGHKLTKEEVAKKMYQNGLTEEEATALLKKDLESHVNTARRTYNKKYGENAFNSVPEDMQNLLVDYSYTGTGVNVFPNFHNAIYNYSVADTPEKKLQAQQELMKNYKRHVNGKELSSRNTFTENILKTLPIKKYGGKKCYTCNQSKLQVLYNKRNYKK